ncbi:hypothetical protein NLI96_g7677 [Meripilus lineatus]|uniref:Glycoside hydrolase family 76 protein n=1 Tax=Meripilus lineatus TaxID=2056292 RepID=A0AAD5UYS3_9APHY|nr:hypothetical protein NLI96_g7677 [Physisporinus lineatus]
MQSGTVGTSAATSDVRSSPGSFGLKKALCSEQYLEPPLFDPISEEPLKCSGFDIRLACFCSSSTYRSRSAVVKTLVSHLRGGSKPTSNHSQSERAVIAQSVVESVIPLFSADILQVSGLEFAETAELYCAISLYDQLASNMSHKGTVQSMLTSVPALNPGFYSASEWALTAVYAFRAYSDSSFLDIAATLWDEVSSFLISEQDAATGTHPRMNVTFAKTCQGASTAGGVFLDANGTNPLSAYLFEATSDSKYADAAELALNFIKLHLYNGTMIHEGITFSGAGSPDDACSSSPFFQAFILGLCFEGISVYANATGNSEWMSFIQNLIGGIIKSPGFPLLNGILANGSEIIHTSDDPLNRLDGEGQATKGLFVRGIYVAWSRIDPTTAIAQLIKAFLTVQYNALLDLASEPGVYQFSSKWQGPPYGQLLPWGQAAALPVLDAALGLVTDPTASHSSSPTASQIPNSTASQSTSPTKNANVPLITGVSVAAAAVLLVPIILAYLVWRRRRRYASISGDRETLSQNANRTLDPPSGIRPFTLDPPHGEDNASRPEKSISTGGVLSYHERKTARSDPAASQSTNPPSTDEVQFYDHDTSDIALAGSSHASVGLPATPDSTPAHKPTPATTSTGT